MKPDNIYLYYYGKPVSESEWTRHCDGKIDLKKKLRIKELPASSNTAPPQPAHAGSSETQVRLGW